MRLKLLANKLVKGDHAEHGGLANAGLNVVVRLLEREDSNSVRNKIILRDINHL